MMEHRQVRWYLGLLAWFLLGLSVNAAATETVDLRILTWPGYADADVVAKFEARYQVKLKVSYITNDDDMWQRMQGNQAADYDVFAVNTAELQRYIDQQLAVPISPENIPNLVKQLPRFKPLSTIPGIVREQKLYAIPYTYSEMGLIYNLNYFVEPPRSWRVLWDRQYQAKILAYDGSAHNFSLAALASGLNNPFQLDPQQFADASQRLVELRRNVLTFYKSPEQAQQLFEQEDIALLFANYGTQQLKMLRDSGAAVGYTIPQEGALAWLDCWAIAKGVKNKSLAEKWINYSLEPWVSQQLTLRQGLANTVVLEPHALAEDKIIWLQQVEDQQQRSQYWQKIISGKQIDKVPPS
ncbi:extracellular solute-binding protein [Agarivorans sp.]|uniref:extracellular solute-binding protein n=1 Tax=Agarivorans sp. TaxID=1872412 RepID=UPI003D0245F7